VEGSNPDGSQERIEVMVTQVQQARAALLDADTLLVKQQQENAFLLSQKTDSSRQVSEARRLVDTSLLPNTKGAANLAKTQPFDYESEQSHQKFAAAFQSVQGQMKLLNGCAELLENASHSRDGGSQTLMKSSMDLCTRTKMFNEAIVQMEGKVTERCLVRSVGIAFLLQRLKRCLVGSVGIAFLLQDLGSRWGRRRSCPPAQWTC
jgi:hypothetical protein